MGGSQGVAASALSSVPALPSALQSSGGDGGGDNHESGLLTELQEACTPPRGPNLDLYKRYWDKQKLKKERQGSLQDQDINKVFKWIKYAFRGGTEDKDAGKWRQAGIEAAQLFFEREKFRRKLIQCDFIQDVLLLWLVEDMTDEDLLQDKPEKAKEIEEEHRALQVKAAEVINDMAKYKDFQQECLCFMRVLNFLCIVLNQVPAAVETVTEAFEQLSGHDENLIILIEGAVGDILESFFKTAKFKKPPQEEEDALEQWKKDMPALSHCAHTLGTFVKFNHPCRVNLQQIIAIFRYFLGMDEQPRKDAPDGIRLLAETSRLFYWIIRGSRDVAETLKEASTTGSLEDVLIPLVSMWKKCIDLHEMLKQVEECRKAIPQRELPASFKSFCCDDLDRSLKFDPTETSSNKEQHQALKEKITDRGMLLCYMNCIMWMCLPAADVRWRLRAHGLNPRPDAGMITNLAITDGSTQADDLDLKAYLALELKSKEFLSVILGTIRHLVDQPEAQECHELIRFFADQLLILLDLAVKEHQEEFTKPHSAPPKTLNDKCVSLLLDALSVLALQREAQEKFRQFDIWEKLQLLKPDHRAKETLSPERKAEIAKMELVAMRIEAEVAMHPSHRLAWVAKGNEVSVTGAPTGHSDYPPRKEFEDYLLRKMKDTDSNFKTVASLLLTIFQEQKFMRAPEDIDITFKSVLDWWQANTTARYHELKEEEAEGREPTAHKVTTQELAAMLQRSAMERALTSMETMQYCSPHECVLALTLFSRLALEPKYKKLFFDKALHELLMCVCCGIWPEAREAAAALANVMWLPDVDREWLVCWLKFDGPQCIAVDGSNVLLPLKVGNPKPADIGKGMYRSSWGIEFVDESCVKLHPEGLQTDRIPGILTSASPVDTFANTAHQPVKFLDIDHPNGPDPRLFTITCWFYWEKVSRSTNRRDRVLVQSAPDEHGETLTQIYIDFESVQGKGSDDGIWTIVDKDKYKRPLKTPQLSPGWHMLALVSSTRDSPATNEFNGTLFYLDTWYHKLEGIWVKNNFSIVGNAYTQGYRNPFGLIADFRIYARALPHEELEKMSRAKDASQHPDRILRKLRDMHAAQILAQRVDVPDSAAECLRALANLATLSSERAKIFSVCGSKVLQMLDSPLPMIKRQSSRLLTNIT
mmetsp:Transcript_52414/g.125208  ORF Transcript_52414/g.125208 Transcript_52414/m.125208 type:complete len:1158 (-) Transcript_52414:68-3541(-)